MRKFLKKVKRLAKAYDLKISSIGIRDYQGEKKIDIRVSKSKKED